MIVGATATRRGLTQGFPSQYSRIFSWLYEHQHEISELHHGVCIGGDEEINNMARMLGIYTVGHPPVNTKYMSNCVVDTMWEPAEYLARDGDIVTESDVMLVAPWQNTRPKSIRGSGTWYTHDLAVAYDLGIVLFWPDGRIE
jgi:hypothetical protein